MHEALHERFCQRALDELAGVVHSSAGSAFDRYQRACDLLRNRNQELARAFDDFRRSTAVLQLVIMRRMRLLTDEDLGVFTEQTQQTVRGVDSLDSAEQVAPREPPPAAPVRSVTGDMKPDLQSGAPVDGGGR